MMALVLAAPIGVGCAVFLTEFAPPWLRNPLGFMVELLAAVPSVIFGLWGIFIFVPWLRGGPEKFLATTSASSPSSRGRRSGSASSPPG